MRQNSFLSLLFVVTICLVGLAFLALPMKAAQTPDPHSIPSVNGDIGPCSVEFTVKDASGAPIYNAKIRVHISYGFLGVHKMDLEVGTNVDGKARVNGLPKKVKIPLYFQALQGSKEADTTWDPATSCKAEQTLTLK
jgi:hypothetical protein